MILLSLIHYDINGLFAIIMSSAMERNAQKMVGKIIDFEGNCGQPLMSRFNVQYVINILDRNKIQSIDKIYKSKEDGFDLLEFVRFFLNVLEHQEIETLYLTIALIDFFKEISKTSGGKQKLMFVDITDYICSRILQNRREGNKIESKLVPDYRTIKPNYRIKEYILNPPSIYGSKDEMIYKLSLNKVKIDKSKHIGVVSNCCFSKTLGKVFALDVLSDSIAVYNSSCALVKKIRPSFSKMKKDIVVLSFAYSERQERIGAVLKDCSINFWDSSDNFEFEKSISTASYCPEYQTNIWFFEYFEAWVTSDKTGYLYIWSLNQEKPERKIRLVSQTKVNDVCVIPCLNLIAVVQERKATDFIKKELEEHGNSYIVLYDFFKGEPATSIEISTENRIPHTIQFSETYQVLLSAGYEKKISIFEINKSFLDTHERGQLTGHESLVTSFTILKKSPMVLSADDKGKVKVWDLRNYKCAQTLDFRDKTNITKLLDMFSIGKIGVLGSRINFVEFDQKREIHKKMQNKEKAVPHWIECDYRTHQLIVLSKSDLRVYDLKRGILKNIYCEFHIEEEQITYFKYLESLSRFVIGNEKGELKLYSFQTGRQEAKLIGHAGTVTHIEYDELNKIFISASQDSNIQIQKQPFPRKEENTFNLDGELKELKTLLLRQIKNNFNEREISISAVSIYHGLIVVGSCERSLCVWDYEHLKLLALVTLPTEPTALAFINGYSILLIGTCRGELYCVQLSRKEQGFSAKTLWKHQSKDPSPITHICVDILIRGFTSEKEVLICCQAYAAYASGSITCFDLQEMIDSTAKQPSVTQKKSFNPERQLRQNFVVEVQRKNHTKLVAEAEQCTFKDKQWPARSFQAHHGPLTGLHMIELDRRYVCTIGLDERLKIWQGVELACDLNINLPLPYKWEIQVEDIQKSKQKIMFALKIIRNVFVSYGNEISIPESKALKVKRLFEVLQEQEPKHLTQPILEDRETSPVKEIILFQNQFTKRDMFYDSIKQFNFSEIAGPTLREIEMRKKLEAIQKQWQSNKQKSEEDKSRLLLNIKQKAQKNEEKEQILQFLENRSYGDKPRDSSLDKTLYVSGLVSKMDGMMESKMAMKENQPELQTTSMFNCRKTRKSLKNLIPSRTLYKDQKTDPLLRTKNSRSHFGKTFEGYFKSKTPAQENSLYSTRNDQMLTTGSLTSFRRILNSMNSRMKKSMKPLKWQPGDCSDLSFDKLGINHCRTRNL